jgi:nitroreductase
MNRGNDKGIPGGDGMKTTAIAAMLAAFALAYAGKAPGGEETRIALPEPTKTGGMPLADALAARRSGRAFTDGELAPQSLSDLLWAAAGVNREDGKTTYPVARGRKDMILFVFTKTRVDRYDPAAHALDPVADGDRRADTGSQPFVAQAAVNLVFVHDMALWGDSDPSAGEAMGYAHAGAMMQNVYLHAAAQGWSAVVRGLFDGEKLKTLLRLAPTQRVTLTQSVGPGQ